MPHILSWVLKSNPSDINRDIVPKAPLNDDFVRISTFKAEAEKTDIYLYEVQKWLCPEITYIDNRVVVFRALNLSDKQ